MCMWHVHVHAQVMKMLFMLTVGESGTISLSKGSGNVAVDAGERLGNLLLDDPTLVAKAAPFSAELGDFTPPLVLRLHEGRLHHQLAFLEARVHNILNGFVDNEEEVCPRPPPPPPPAARPPPPLAAARRRRPPPPAVVVHPPGY